MPAKSEKQRKFMAAVANNPEFAKKVGVPKSVGEEFMKPEKKFLGGLFGRRREDRPVKTIRRRGKGPGRTRKSRLDDLAEQRASRKPQGVSSPIKDAAKSATTPPSTRPKAPKADVVKQKKPSPPRSGLARVTGTEQGKTGGVRRNVGSGREKTANVTKEQLDKTGLILRDYLNFVDKYNRRPKTKADAAIAKDLTAMYKAKKAKKPVKKMGGGMMRSKMASKGGARGGRKAMGMKAGGFPDLTGDGKVTQADILKGRGVTKKAKGGMMKKKGYKAGGMAKKGYSKGGAVRRGKPRGVGAAKRGFGKAMK